MGAIRELLVSWGLKFLSGLGGFWGWLIDIILNILWKRGKAIAIEYWNRFLDRQWDKEKLDEYKKEIEKGPNADEKKKIELEEDILNGRRR